jgi:hypothetical protein
MSTPMRIFMRFSGRPPWSSVDPVYLRENRTACDRSSPGNRVPRTVTDASAQRLSSLPLSADSVEKLENARE